jgi:hypothetical protein
MTPRRTYRYSAGERYERRTRDRKQAGGVRRRPILDDYRKGTRR